MKENKNKQILFAGIGLVILIIAVVGVTFAFFSYVRTGSPNTIASGRIYFNSTQNGRLQLTNIFPLTSTQVGDANLDSVTVAITGDTTYLDGEEFLISLVDVENTISGKTVPMNYIATYELNTGGTIGSSSNDYWNARENKDSTIYQLTETGRVEENKQVLVGYIDNGEIGINGTLTIKAYIDADRIAISDTYDGTESDNMGTTTSWVNGRTVFTTTEWNSLQSASISFKIKAESQEGIWVEEPSDGTIESCPNCKFIYTTEPMYTTWNMASWDPYMEKAIPVTPTDITDFEGEYSTNYNDIVESSGQNYFLGVITNGSNQITRAFACGLKDATIPFCIEGDADGSKYSSNSALINGPSLWNNTCIVGTEDGVTYTDCGSWDGSSVSTAAASYGDVKTGVDDSDGFCRANSIGEVRCKEFIAPISDPIPGGALAN